MKEIRYIKEIRILEDSRTIQGTAIVFDSLSEDLGGFREIIHPDSISKEFIDSQDIVMLYNHEQNSGVLARSKKGTGTLKLTVDEIGVHFEFTAKNTGLGNEVLESIRSGDLDACSFAFVIGEDRKSIVDGQRLRTILSFRELVDLSVVVYPAYKATEVNVRCLNEFVSLEKEEEDRNKELAQIEENRKKDIESYYSNLRKRFGIN